MRVHSIRLIQLEVQSIGSVRVSFNQSFLDSFLESFLEILKRGRNEKRLRNDVKTPPEEFLGRF
jgi:23S rRNA maturation mini-RNase III